jgi:2-oxoisovalerate dehydrogenase E2 component (dihydrolipoyl transacylase)
MSVLEFRLPDVGEGLTEAEVVHWYVSVGQVIGRGDALVEIETAKSLVELPSPFDGEVTEILVAEGETVTVGTVLVRVSEPVASPPAEAPTDTADEDATVAQPAEAPTDTADEDATVAQPAERTEVLVGYGLQSAPTQRRRRRTQQTPDAPVGSGAGGADHARAKPPVRKLAHELGVDLETVVPTGPDGTISREDVTALASTPRPAAAPDTTRPAAVPVPVANVSLVPVSGVRRATAAAMCRSAFSAPHASLFYTVDVSRTVRLVHRLQREPALEGVKVTALTVVAAALLSAVRRYPDVNTSWDDAGDAIVHYPHVNLGIATASPRGLLVPNVKHADAMTLPRLAAAILDITRRAKAGEATPQDMTGGTITITNVGVFGVDTGIPILNPGEAAILCLGAIRRVPWEHRGQVRLRWVTQLGLSFDHRLVDGELGGRVLAHVGRVLHNPRWELLVG